jgi:hypothetical protein
MAVLYLVDIHATVERGLAIEATGGPGPTFKHISERFKPDHAYFTPDARRLFLIVDLDPARMVELMAVATRASGAEPRFIPVLPLSEAMHVIGEAMQHAAKAPKVG